MHGHGILHLQTSNQSPESCQFGILLVAAAIEFDAKGIILAFLHLVTETEIGIADTLVMSTFVLIHTASGRYERYRKY